MSLIQYLKETRGELHHVAWPTRVQTIVYTVMVIFLSVGISLYLGLFDFLITTGLARGIDLLPQKTKVLPAAEVSTSSLPAGITFSTTTLFKEIQE